MVMLGGGTDVLGAVVVPGGDGAWPELAGRVEQGAAQVLRQPQPVAGHGQAAPAAGSAVQDGPDQAQAAGLAGEPADDLSAAAGLAEGPLDEVRMPDPVVVLRRESQVGGQPLAVGEQALHRRRVGGGVPGGQHGAAGRPGCSRKTRGARSRQSRPTPSRRRRAQPAYSSLIWPPTEDTVDLEIAARSPRASARAASTSRTERPRTNE